MLFSLLYHLVRCLLGATHRAEDERDIEILVLRHQLQVLRRQVKRPTLNRLDRLLLAAVSRSLPRSAWSSFIVTPTTLLRWHGSWSGESGPSEGRGSRAGHHSIARPLISSCG